MCESNLKKFGKKLRLVERRDYIYNFENSYVLGTKVCAHFMILGILAQREIFYERVLNQPFGKTPKSAAMVLIEFV